MGVLSRFGSWVLSLSASSALSLPPSSTSATSATSTAPLIGQPRSSDAVPLAAISSSKQSSMPIREPKNKVVIHELIHASDDCHAKNMDWRNCWPSCPLRDSSRSPRWRLPLQEGIVVQISEKNVVMNK